MRCGLALMTVSWWIASALCETPLSSAAQESWGAKARTPTATAMSVIHWRRVESRGAEDKVSGVFTIASIGSTAGSLQIFPQLMNGNIKAKYDQYNIVPRRARMAVDHIVAATGGDGCHIPLLIAPKQRKRSSTAHEGCSIATALNPFRSHKSWQARDSRTAASIRISKARAISTPRY